MERLVPDPSGYVLRPPVVQDATERGQMQCRVWKDTYADSMDPQAYAALSSQRFADSWSRILSHAVAKQPANATMATDVTTVTAQTFVAEHAQDGIVGFITLGPARDDDPPVPHQLWVPNIAADHRGTGLAQHLVANVLGDGPAYLWVARGNDRAITFYERHGFSADGTEVVDEQDGIAEVRMVRCG